MTGGGSAAIVLAEVSRVRVGTQNRAKLEAVTRGLAGFARDFETLGVDVESGVSEQPVGFDEIVAGARNRARAAFESGPCDLAFGIEDGLVVVPAFGSDAMNVGAAVATDGFRTSVGLSSGFAYPTECGLRAVADREPVGGLFDALVIDGERAATPSGRLEGNVGRITGGALTRAEYGSHAVICALVRFLHPDLYDWRSGDDAEPPAARGSRPSA